MRKNKKEVQPVVLDGQIFPSDELLEQSVLGSIILDTDTINIIAQDFSATLFHEPSNKIIAEAILTLFKANKPIDMLTLIAQLKTDGNLADVGGAYYISTLTNKSAGNINILFHIKMLQQKSLERNLINIANKAVVSIINYKDDVFDVYARTQSEIEDSLKNVLKYEVKTIFDIHHDILERNINIIEKGIKSGVPCGFRLVDNITNGWQKSDLIILAGRPSMGKCLTVSSLVYTNDGYIKIGDAEIGKQILGSDGLVYEITGVFPQGKKSVYRVYFDDNTFVDCCDEHLWEVSTRSDRKASYGSKEMRASVLKTSQMIDNVICMGGRNNYSVKIVKPLNFNQKEVTINPYLLGFYLGDGYSSNDSVRLSNTEQDIIDKIKGFLSENDKLKQIDYKDYRVNNSNKSKDGGLWAELNKLGLVGKKSDEKFIPKNYLYNTIEIRTMLLRGLVDTDGHIPTKGRSAIEYSTVSVQLRDDILELVRGLGGKATYITRQGAYIKDGERFKAKEYYRMYLSLPPEIMPVSSKKHLEKYNGHKTYHRKFITEIEKLGTKEEMICISVNSPDNLYITNGYTLTHNTAAAVSLIIHPAVEKNIPIAIFSLEMSKFQIGSRIQSFISGINVSKIVKGQLNMDEVRHIVNICEPLNKAPLYIDDTPNISLIELKSKARKLVKDKGVQMIVIDYLQLMRSGLDIMNREQEIAEISRGLKNLAKELNIPVIALSQLSRLVEARSDKKPMLSDLRESGQIEQDADMVIFCYRPEYYGIEQYEVGNQSFPSFGLMMLLVSKHRNGELGEIPLKFVHEQAKIEDLQIQNNFTQSNTNSNNNSTFVPQKEEGAKLDNNTDFLNQDDKAPF